MPISKMRQSKLLSTLLWLLISFLGRVKGNAIIQPDCVTPTNILGKCTEVRFCVTIMNALVNNDHLTNTKVSQFLRESQCGIQRGSHKVCCDVNDIDFGSEISPNTVETTTSRLATILQQPIEIKPLSDINTCGKLNRNETPKKWVGELWFKVEGFSKSQLESKCLGTLISHKHLVAPAHCVASLPKNITLDFVEVGNFEFSVSKIYIHASYNQPKFANDIAIIELDREDGDEINDAVCLPESASNAMSSIAIVKRAGGSLKFGKAQSISNDECSSFFNQQFTELTAGQFCASVQSNETTFTPFIGAIVMESDRKRQYTLKGFTSTSVRTGGAFDESKPYIFTDLTHHLNWIQTAIGSELAKNQTKTTRIVESTQNLHPCEMSNGNGFCVELQQCALYRDAPQPLSQQRTAFLDQVKCFIQSTNDNNVNEDGICCPPKYIEQNNTENYNFDLRIQGKRGTDLLDLKKCGQVDVTRRIVGGSKADLKEFPWIGLVKYQVGRIFKFTCGSSLISQKYVLTCAHCITNLPNSYEVVGVRLGEYNRTSDPDCIQVDDNQQECTFVQDLNIAKLIPHPKYNSPRYANDVGLIRLATLPDFTQGIIPICLPINNEMQQTISEKYTVAGFGFTEHGQDSDILLKVVLPKVSKETCQSFHSSVIQLSEGHECYGGQGIRDSCKGDSGNPLMNYVNLNGKIKAVQLGVVAAGHSDCGRGASGFPGIYSNVKFYLSWILDQMEV